MREALIESVPANELISDHDVLLTRRGNVLYVHMHQQPITDAVYLHPIVELPRRAVVLNTGRDARVDVADLPRLQHLTPNRGLRISKLPVNRQSVVGWVIKLEFDRLPAAGAGAGPLADTDQGVADGQCS